jgi:YegS/Rv2252/BmrU family lipid kinase
MESIRRILVLMNPRSGLGISQRKLMEAFEEVWDQPPRVVSYQFSQSMEDGKRKIDQAITDGIDTIFVVGGDGMINTIGGELLNTGITLGVIPAGSGNGFGRHFEIPLQPEKAVQALAKGSIREIDVGMANDRPFFVTCSLAWDAAIVKTFERSPVRGVLPYVFAAAYELFDYKAEEFRIRVDDGPAEAIEEPMLFTIANLTQYGGGALIAPQARADDGKLWLTYARRSDVPKLISQLPKLFEGKINQADGITAREFTRLHVVRESAQPLQVDGELVESTAEVTITIKPKSLKILVPQEK